MKINIIAVGKLKEKFWTEAVNEYIKRIGRFAELSVVEVEECRTPEQEGELILKKLKGCVIIMDIGGMLVGSEDLALALQNCLNTGKSKITFVIGGSDGLSKEVKARADLTLSFGRVTYPHQLFRVILSEQIYRAVTIIHGVTYHK